MALDPAPQTYRTKKKKTKQEKAKPLTKTSSPVLADAAAAAAVADPMAATGKMRERMHVLAATTKRADDTRCRSMQ